MELNFKHSSRKALNLLREIDPNIKRNIVTPNISPDVLANCIIELFRVTEDKKDNRRNLKIELGQLKTAVEQNLDWQKTLKNMK